MKLPRRILVILEGEGLANDATALILYRFAVAAVSAGVFSFNQAAELFAAIVAGEIVWGIGTGWLILRLRRWVRDPRIEITLSILTPFLAYWPPAYLGGSGVLATVTAGLYISWNGLRLISAATRLQGIFFWDFLIYLVEGMVFLITGLQARTLIARIGDHQISELAISAALVSAVVIVTRFVWMYPATYLPRWLFPPLKRRDPSPPWQWPFVLAFTGVRGIVSLAAALAIPFVTVDGQPFPGRDLILFLTFSVILVTLVGPRIAIASGDSRTRSCACRGCRAPRWQSRGAHGQDEVDRGRDHAAGADHGGTQSLRSIVQPLRARHRDRLKHIENVSAGDGGHEKPAALLDEIELMLITEERRHINELYRGGELMDESRRRIERELDLREVDLANQEREE